MPIAASVGGEHRAERARRQHGGDPRLYPAGLYQGRRLRRVHGRTAMNQVEDDFEKAVSAAIPAGFEPALRLIHDRLAGMAHPWGITGSLGMILQGMPLTAGDIDLQSDRDGA